MDVVDAFEMVLEGGSILVLMNLIGAGGAGALRVLIDSIGSLPAISSSWFFLLFCF